MQTAIGDWQADAEPLRHWKQLAKQQPKQLVVVINIWSIPVGWLNNFIVSKQVG